MPILTNRMCTLGVQVLLSWLSICVSIAWNGRRQIVRRTDRQCRGAYGTSERIVHIAVNQGHFVPDISSPVANPNIIHGRMTGVTNNAN